MLSVTGAIGSGGSANTVSSTAHSGTRTASDKEDEEDDKAKTDADDDDADDNNFEEAAEAEDFCGAARVRASAASSALACLASWRHAITAHTQTPSAHTTVHHHMNSVGGIISTAVSDIVAVADEIGEDTGVDDNVDGKGEKANGEADTYASSG